MAYRFGVTTFASPATALAVLALILVGCSTPTTSVQPSASPTATQSTAEASRLPTPAPAPAPTTVVTALTSFSSPTGNIRCGLDASYVRCDISQRSFTMPPKPADCNLDWGSGLELGTAGQSQIVCAGDAIDGKDLRLPYGQAIRAGKLICASAEAGITCSQVGNGHGFFLSRASYRQF